jgi:hypothetical protein
MMAVIFFFAIRYSFVVSRPPIRAAPQCHILASQFAQIKRWVTLNTFVPGDGLPLV